MKSLFLFFAVASSQFAYVNDGPVAKENLADAVQTETTNKRSVQVYVNVQKLLANDKHKTLAVELLEIEHGKTKRLQSEALGDLFVDITPYIVDDIDQKNGSPHRQVLSTSFKDPNGNERFRKEIGLANQPAVDTVQSINEYFESEVFDNGDSAAPIINPNVVSNSLIIESSSEIQMKQIATMVKALDVRPPMLKAKMVIGRFEKDGKVKYLSRPSIMTIENLVGKVSIGATRLDGSLDGYSVELTMRQVAPE